MKAGVLVIIPYPTEIWMTLGGIIHAEGNAPHVSLQHNFDTMRSGDVGHYTMPEINLHDAD